jgi:sterol-4alpha-carboxylate 3-dehydrogenase (decarboxylating)
VADNNVVQDGESELYLLFGATGMLGSALLEQLLSRNKRVRVFVEEPIADNRVEQIVGDIRDVEMVRKAVSGADVVFQTVAIIDWTPKRKGKLYDVNVQGNRNVIESCVDFGVKKLIYTSSIDVVIDGHDLYYVDETTPYVQKPFDPYAESKMIAEKEVLAANGRPAGKECLLTCVLRPTGIYGPKDSVRLPNVIEAIRKGKPYRLGNGTALFSHVYVDNVAYAHILAAENLEKGSPLEGQYYFITDHEATNFFDFVYDDICKKLGYEIPSKRIPYWMAKTVAMVTEWWATITKPDKPPLLTNYVVAATCKHCSFNHEKATGDFGYQPIVSREEAIRKTVEDLYARGFAKHAE